MEVKNNNTKHTTPSQTALKFYTEIIETEATLTPLTYIHERLLCWFGTGN